MKIHFTFCLLLVLSQLNAQHGANHQGKFEQLGQTLADPNMYRSASGAPGPKYWQQRADYNINATLTESDQRIRGSETITYYNNSPEILTFLWLQLDENVFVNTNEANTQNTSKMNENMSLKDVRNLANAPNDLGIKIEAVTDVGGKALHYVINETMMRVDLPKPLKTGEKFAFKVTWNYRMVNRIERWGRGGYEYFSDDSNYMFTIAQWYPRMCVYSDWQGWNHKQFTGTAEFALTFGNFDVSLTVPADYMVAGTGQCSNYASVLTAAQLSRYKKATQATEPVEIVLKQEAIDAEKNKTKATKTWNYHAENVRDFAMLASPKLIWDAMNVTIDGKNIMAMSYYPKEAYGLYRKYSTRVVATTLKTYSKYTIGYPYPVAISCEAASGMEYPMICFNFGRTEKDGTYSEATKNGMIGVIIHEVGHNFFPMIVNSDERQWTWMDEGLNTFCQYLTEQAWDVNFPSRRGPAHRIVDYMKLPKEQLEPIMTNGDNLVQRGGNGYGKPATALNILRETILGRDLFDFAFKEYARRWAFKHPTPNDFFRTMEDASGTDLDWFWRGWFFGIEPCDISIDKVSWYKVNTKNPKVELADKETVNNYEESNVSRTRNMAAQKSEVETDTALADFYTSYNKYEPSAKATEDYNTYLESLSADEKSFLSAGKNFYQINFKNLGGLLMPVILEMTFADGSKQIERMPASIWRINEDEVRKVFITDKEVVSFKLDPYRETADIDESNNVAGKPTGVPNKFELFKEKQSGRRGGSTGEENPMQRARKQ
ncbi:MAG: M1 family peptidase [Bacteroidia bacterium]|nr:M1 family peptidase [Bacteroidia bacterium]